MLLVLLQDVASVASDAALVDGECGEPVAPVVSDRAAVVGTDETVALGVASEAESDAADVPGVLDRKNYQPLSVDPETSVAPVCESMALGSVG